MDSVNLTDFKSEEPLEFETVIEGQPLTSEMRIIGALVRRLGGTVVLAPAELDAVQGVVIRPTSEGIRIDAGNSE